MKKFIWPIAILALLASIYFIFIPAFAGKLIISPVMQLGAFALRWYGIILAAGILASYFWARRHSWRFGISADEIDSFSFWLVIFGLLGARLYYILFSLDHFRQNWAEVYQIWHGGLSIYGAVLAGIIFLYFYTRQKAYSFWQAADLIALGLPLGQAIGRLGNFVNQEAFGTPTDLPWKMYVSPLHRPAQFGSVNYFHPAFLYEILADLLIFLLLWKLAKKSRPGTIILTYLSVYSFLRFFIEAIRVDSFFVLGFRGDQLIAFVLFVAAAGWLIWRQASVAQKA